MIGDRAFLEVGSALTDGLSPAAGGIEPEVLGHLSEADATQRALEASYYADRQAALEDLARREAERSRQAREVGGAAFAAQQSSRIRMRREVLPQETPVAPDAAPDDNNWREKALCAKHDPELFYPKKGESTGEAKKICARCEVKSQCLEYALDHDEPYGVWGGLSERERRRLRRRAA